MSSHFGQLVIDTLNSRNLTRVEAYRIFKDKSTYKSCYKVFYDKYLLESHHKISWCYQVCKIFNINAEKAFQAILEDENAERLTEQDLITYKPKLYLYSYAFTELYIEQLISIIENFSVKKIKQESSYDCINEHVERIARAISKVAELSRYQFSIEKRIYELDIPDNMKEVLLLRFFEVLSIEEISEQTGYNYRWILDLQHKGLEALKSSI